MRVHPLLCRFQPVLACGIAVFLFTGLHGLSAQEADTGLATISGVVSDVSKRPISGARVEVLTRDGAALQSGSTDAEGRFRFLSVPTGNYHLRATTKTGGEADSDAFFLAPGQTRNLDLTVSANASTTKNDVDFFDHPTFSVAGVTDTTNLGGHGSNTLTRTEQSLAKDVVGLEKSPSASDTAEEVRLREAADHHPSDFFANHQAGKVLLADGRGTQALPYLERARNLRPDDYENEFALAGAYMASGNLSNARSIVAHLLNTQDRSELHNLLGAIEERSGDPVKAEQEYRLAAKQDPTERNLFDWGAELLLHHVPAAATDVFNEGVRRFPASARMLTALGVTWYARGSYPQASEILGRAADLNPTEPTPYIFLGRILMIEASVPEGTSERIQRFLKLAPQDAWANYLAAIDLWKRTHATQDRANLDHIQALLARATELDPSFALAFFQRGVVCSEVGDIPAAMAALQHAVAADPTLAEPHYRLAQLYRRAGDEVNARRELSRYAELTASDAARADRERHEIQQFVISSHDPQTSKQ